MERIIVRKNEGGGIRLVMAESCLLEPGTVIGTHPFFESVDPAGMLQVCIAFAMMRPEQIANAELN